MKLSFKNVALFPNLPIVRQAIEAAARYEEAMREIKGLTELTPQEIKSMIVKYRYSLKDIARMMHRRKIITDK